METTFEIDSTIYECIFKTIYMFLENNNFQNTAQCFLHELLDKYKIGNINEAPNRTIILRTDDAPLESEVNLDNEDEVIVCFAGQQKLIQEETNASYSISERLEGENKMRTFSNPPSEDVENMKKILFTMKSEQLNLIDVARELTQILQTLDAKRSAIEAEMSANQFVVVASSMDCVSEANCKPEDSMSNDEMIYHQTKQLTDEEMLATNVPCSGDWTNDTAPKSIQNDIELRSVSITRDNHQKGNDSTLKTNLNLKAAAKKKQLKCNSKSKSKSVPDETNKQQSKDLNAIRLAAEEEERQLKQGADDIVTMLTNHLRDSDRIDKLIGTDDSKMERFDLNAGLLKDALLYSHIEVKMKVLQALRWRLTTTERHVRDAMLKNIIINDILMLNNEDFVRSCFCPIATSTPHPIQEEIARFVNTLASLSLGRKYIQQQLDLLKDVLLPLLMERMNAIKISRMTKEFLVAIVQKLSLNANVRKIIINSGAVEWLINYIQMNHSTMSNYEAEYSTAMLTNLCINKETRLICERLVDDGVMAMLTVLIQTPHQCCLPYLNGILYSLLCNATINAKAVECDLELKLQTLYFRLKDYETKRKLEMIMSMLGANVQDIIDEENNNLASSDAHEYNDYIEPELNENEQMYTEPIGEELLNMFRCEKQSDDKLTTNEPSYHRYMINRRRDHRPLIVRSASILLSANTSSSNKLTSIISATRTSQNRNIIEVVLNDKSKSAPPPLLMKNAGTEAMPASDVNASNKTMQAKKKKNLGKTNKEEQLMEATTYFKHEAVQAGFDNLSNMYYNANSFLPCLEKNRSPEDGAANKYSCQCYEAIRTLLEQVPSSQAANHGDKQQTASNLSNVIFGPLNPSMRCCCNCNYTHHVSDENGCTKENAFESRPKLHRTP